MKQEAKKYAISISAYQSNHEGKLIDYLQKKAKKTDGIIINPGAFSHYSYALYDALKECLCPIVEVHLSDIMQREPWRAHSVTAKASLKMIAGKKQQGYLDALSYLAQVMP